jgi:hypothetical protein
MEPTPPELGAGTGSPHELVIEGREELLYLLGEAAELEHSVCCSYLYAAFTSRPTRRRADGRAAAGRGGVEADDQRDRAAGNDPPGPGQQPAGSPRGGAPSRPPQPSPRSPYAPEIQLTLAPFSEQTLQPFLHIERPEGLDISTMAGALEEPLSPPPALTGPLVLPAPQAFASIGELYHGIERGLRGLVNRYGEGQVFVGSPNAQASARYCRAPERMPE